MEAGEEDTIAIVDDDDKSTFVCPICAKNIGHLNEIRRIAHTNRCLDDNETLRKYSCAVRRHDTTIDCPLCDRPLPPGPEQGAHLKRCGQLNDVSPGSLIQLVKTRRRIAERRRKNGLTHTIAPKPTLASCRAKTKPMGKLAPRSTNDEKLQLVKAISASLTTAVAVDVCRFGATAVDDPKEMQRIGMTGGTTEPKSEILESSDEVERRLMDRLSAMIGRQHRSTPSWPKASASSNAATRSIPPSRFSKR